MRIVSNFRRLALVGGMAAVLPIAGAVADESVRLDAAQLDAITAGNILVGIGDPLVDGSGLQANANANGFLFSQGFGLAQVQSVANPTVGVATGTAVATAIAIGSTGNNPPTATAETPPPAVIYGTVLVDRSGGRTISRPGIFEASYSYRAIAVVDDSLGLF